ncbi:MAG TPA: FtsQ-type POTRA domain-containing protein [Bryobacteraceae bacterium]|nr:FtsQ-type POTRA domain-containing protein [Bryobacteraceae bacterium]
MAPQATKKVRWFSHAVVRYGILVAAAGMLLASGIYASQRFEKFMIRDSRFFLPGPPDYGLESPNLEVTGIKYASRTQILHIFQHDYGRSLYLFPLAERRKSLLDLKWVSDASVARIWPNRIVVHISERQPAAFVKLPGSNIARWGLIDQEGVILDPPAKATFALPVLAGVQPSESQDMRGRRVRRMQRLMKDLGKLADNVSEVDASDLDNLKIDELVNGKMVSLLLGDHNFSSRVQNFLEHYADIHRRLPQATTFDLRLDDRITGSEAANDAR